MSGLDGSGRRPKPDAIGRGGISRVSEATGLSRITIRAGLSELYPPPLSPIGGSQPSGPAARRRAEAPDRARPEAPTCP